MPRKVIITTDFPTPDEIAASLHIPPARVAELRRLMAEIAEAERKRQSATPRRKQLSKKK